MTSQVTQNYDLVRTEPADTINAKNDIGSLNRKGQQTNF